MNTGADLEANQALEEEKSKNRHVENEKKQREEREVFEEYLEELLTEKRNQEFRQKPLKVFRNNYKNFQYDYEEDFYEPVYGEEIEE